MNVFLFLSIVFIVLFVISISGGISYLNSLQEDKKRDTNTDCQINPSPFSSLPLDMFFLVSGILLSFSLSYLFAFQIQYGNILLKKQQKISIFISLSIIFLSLTIFFSFLMKGTTFCDSLTQSTECLSLLDNTLRLPSFQCDTSFHMNYYYIIMLLLLIASFTVNIVLQFKHLLPLKSLSSKEQKNINKL